MEKLWLDSTYFLAHIHETQYREYKAQAAKDCAALCARSLLPLEQEGWLDSARYATMLEEMGELAARVRKEADVFVLIGVGGSNQAARAVIKALRPAGGPEIIYAGHTLSPRELAYIQKKVCNKNVFLNVIAKNFSTLEPGSHFRLLRDTLRQKYGRKEAARRIVATGTEGERLWKLARQEGYAFLPFPVDVCGRYSALTPVGIFPMMVAGVDCARLLAGAGEMERMIREAPGDNPAVEYAALRNAALAKGCLIETLATFEPGLAWLARWWVQLFGESEGKDGKGIYPSRASYSEDLHAMGQYMQEGRRMLQETFLCVKDPGVHVFVPEDGDDDGFGYLAGWDFADINRVAYKSTIRAHTQEGGVPCLELGLPNIGEETLGQLFYFFMVSCVLSSRLQGVDPFGQSGVEAYKYRMMKGLGNG